ncbi:HAD family hydrolase [Gluconobacter wancherniae]|uniref:HAD family hydrolase n=1 Tax=Gluconobacter wancherniae TaxID=1307955 RepID=UPI001B8CBB1C|nr:HAD family hydrolase [Gluconobacter wancherniae]MBS1093096.1 HAD family hydrolase [Gluconobacter wancherniae]
MTRFPIVLLDYDGTLAETRPAILRSLAVALKECDVPPPPLEELAQELARGATLGELFRTLMPGSTSEQEQHFIAAYRNHYPAADQEETFLFDGAAEMIEGLHRLGIKPVILSNKHRPFVDASLERFGLTGRVAAVLGSEPSQPAKPDARVMTDRVLPLFPGAAIEDFLMVGDTVTDIRFAQAAGIAVCWVSYGHGLEQVCRDLKPDFEISDVRDLLKLVG